MAKKEEKESIQIYLDFGQEIVVSFDGEIFDKVMDELHKAINSGVLFSLDGSFDVEMYDAADNYLSALNGRKIVGYNI